MILTIPSSLIIPSIPSSISQKEAKGRDLYYVDEKKTIISCSSVVSICPDLEIFMTKKKQKRNNNARCLRGNTCCFMSVDFARMLRH